MDKPSVFRGMFIHNTASADIRDASKGMAAEFNIALLPELPDTGIYLNIDNSGAGLCDTSTPKQAPVKAEFVSPEMQYRLKKSGAKSELIMRAIGNKQGPCNVIDATPGLGRDAMVMANFGCQVTMLERSPAVAVILADGLRQLQQLLPDLRNNLSLYCDDSIHTLNEKDLKNKGLNLPDVVYLDPMFPHRKKSALVKKEMQLFQRLLGHDPDADALFNAAIKVAKKRVVVKRPNTAEPLNKQKPNLTIDSKKHRFDVYLTG